MSHAAADEELARFVKTAIEHSFPGIDVFVSSDPEDLPIGDPWVERILGALEKAQLVLVLGTSRSFGRKWVWFEAGAGWNRRHQIFTGCVGKARKNNLEPPFSQHTARNLDESKDCEELFALIKNKFSAAHDRVIDYEELSSNLVRLDVRAELREELLRTEDEDKPFREAQKHSFDKKLGSLDAFARDILRYLLINGESDGAHIYAAALFDNAILGGKLDFAEKSGLVLHRVEWTRNEATRYWRTNPQYDKQLRIELFPRAEGDGPPRFRL